MPHRYSKQEHIFLASHCKGRTTYELLDMFNSAFNLSITRGQLRCYLKNHNLKSGLSQKLLGKEFCKSKYTEEQHIFIRENCKGRTTIELSKMFTEHFGIEMTDKQVKAYMSRYKLTNGVNAQFKKGNVPPNKGKKVILHPNAIATQFKKGQKPFNWMPVGTERINSIGYVDIKIAEPNKWRGKHLIIWEEHNGEIPQGYKVVFADGDRFNFDIDNLILMTNSEMLTLNRYKLLVKGNAELTKVGVNIAKLINKVNQINKIDKQQKG